MDIFILKGKIKGMVKLDAKLHICLNNVDSIATIILCEKYQKIKVLKSANFNEYINDIKPDSIVILDYNDNVLCAGSSQGKVNINSIIKMYFNKKTAENRGQMTNIDVGTKNENKMNVAKAPQQIGKKEAISQMKENEEKELYIKLDENIEKGVQFVANEIEKQLQKNKGLKADGKCEVQKLDVQEQKLQDDTAMLKEKKEELQNEEKEKMQFSNDEFKTIFDKVPQEDLNDNEKIKLKNSSDNFFAKIKNDIDGFFAEYPTNEELENVIFSSKWISVDDIYSVGVIYEENIPNIIAYAMPYERKDFVLDKFSNIGEWVATDKDTPDGRGYLLYYQDAMTGKMITS